jgi:hypothetical protein
VKVGDLVRVNTKCDAGGLWHKVGVVMSVGRFCKSTTYIEDDGMRADIMIGGRLRRFAYYSLDVISESR